MRFIQEEHLFEKSSWLLYPLALAITFERVCVHSFKHFPCTCFLIQHVDVKTAGQSRPHLGDIISIDSDFLKASSDISEFCDFSQQRVQVQISKVSTDTFCMVVDVDPKTVILIRDCVSCSSLQFSLLGTRIQSVCECDWTVRGKEAACFCLCMYMTVCDISLGKRERLNLASYFCKYMTHSSYLSLAV